MSVEPAHQPPTGPTQPTTPTTKAKKSGNGCMKGCLGCGCLSVIAVVVAALGFGFYLWSQGPALTEGISKSVEVFSSQGSMDFSGEGGEQPSFQQMLNGGGDGGASGSSNSDGGSSDGLAQADRFFAHLNRPMSKREIQQVEEGLREWSASRPVQRFQTDVEALQKLEGSDSPLDGIRAFRRVVGVGFRIRDISEQFPEFVEEQGGEEFLQNYAQVTAIARVSQLGAGNQDPWAQEVADALLADHDENQEAYQEARAMLQEGAERDFASLSQEEQMQLQEAFSNQFLLITAAINRESLEAWAALSAEERKAMIDELSQPHSYVTRIFGLVQSEGAEDVMYLHMLGF